MAGAICLGISLACAILAMLAYEFRKGGAPWGRRLALASFAGAAAAGAALLWAIFQNDFGIEYVASYSSRDLAPVYKVSAFWAGQQGSFLLWLIIHAAAGAWLALRERMNAPGMAVYFLLQSLLAVLVLGKSPFLPQAEAMADGMGLNPLLQDPWMAIHPPVIFVGYALLAVPLAYSAGALWKDAADASWLEPARKWTLAAWAFLGAGIFIGGYWAYKVLGWGGYWGWDPVENSSLVPWLLAGALLHLLKLAAVRPPVRVMAHLAAIFTFSFVLYGTFLTRSGILGDFSVHSFSGTSIGLLIAAVNAFVLIAALCQLIGRMKRLPQGLMYETYASREFLLALGMLMMAFLAAVVFLGMSMPLLTQMAGRPAAVDASFYVKVTLPLAIFLMLALAVSCLRRYGGAALEVHSAARALLVASFFLGGAAALLVGVREALPVLLAGAALFGAAASVVSFSQRGLRPGGMAAHVGLGLGLFAIVLSGSGSQSASQELAVGEPQEVLGHTIAFRGQEFAADGKSKQYVYEVDGSEVRALTKLRSNGEDAAREPAIAKSVAGDVYLAPVPAADSGVRQLTLQKNKAVLEGDFAYLYEGTEQQETEQGGMAIAAQISITDGERVEQASPVIEVAANRTGRSTPIEVMDGRQRLRLTGITEDYRRVRVEILPSVEAAASQPITVSVSTKPFIWLLWLACVLVTAGCLRAVPRK